MSVFLAAVPLTNRSEISYQILSESIDECRSHDEAFPNIDDVQSDDGSIAFGFGGVDVVMQIIDAPISQVELEDPIAASVLWPNAKSDLEGHNAHCLITTLGDIDPVMLSTRLTQITSAFLGTTSDALGVFLTQARLLIPKNIFVEMTQKILPKGAPIYIWIDFRVGSGTPSGASGFTVGMAELGHKEIEVLNAPRSVPEVRNILHNLCDYLLENGPVINEGDTIGEDEHEQISVSLEASEFGNFGLVMRLNFDAI